MAAKSKGLVKEEWRELRNTIYTFFYYSNKPIGSSEIVLQFKNQKKATVEKVLDDLVEKGKIVIKTAGRSKVYYLAQDMNYEITDPEYTDEVDAAQDQIEENKVVRFLKWKHRILNKELQDLKHECEQLDLQITAFDGEMSAAELTKAIPELEKYVEANREFESVECIDENDYNARKKELEAFKKKDIARRKMLKEMLCSIAEGLDIKVGDLKEDAGIE